MLTLLSISNIALIDELQVEFDHGLNLLTGETGSGKSIIVDAMGVLIGGRFTSDMIKAGETRGFIEGLFLVEHNTELEELLQSAGIQSGRPQSAAPQSAAPQSTGPQSAAPQSAGPQSGDAEASE